MSAPQNPDFSEDRLLGGRVILRQPSAGFRTSIDPVLLAASIAGQPGETVLELGAGTGAASLCLAVRLPGSRITGIELQADLASLAQANAERNGFQDRVSIVEGDIGRPIENLAEGCVTLSGFDHVMANPPYLQAGTATLPVSGPRALAVGEGEADLAIWVHFALAAVKPRGSVTFIHRADRLDALLGLLAAGAGEIAIFPLWPKADRPAKRVLVRARRGVGTPLKLLPGMILHNADGSFTHEAEAVLRHLAPIWLAP